ncbi:MAG: copper chaperone PCu(A)C [Hyphomicrobiales bacterium]
MKNLLKTAVLAASIMTPAITGAMEMEFKAGYITVKNATVRATLPGSPAAAYFLVANDGSTDEKIVAASSPKAERVELHMHHEEDGVMKMRKIESIDIPANSVVYLKPGGLHMMMFGLTAVPDAGDMVPLTVTFENAGKVDIKAMATSMKSGSGHGSSSHGHSNSN